jgi:hypothetical protein
VSAENEFVTAIPKAPGSNSIWGTTYARHVKQIMRHAAEHAPRSVQRTLGPSEIGAPCARQIVGKLVGYAMPGHPGGARTNHVPDMWPAIIGTAVHAWMGDTFDRENETLGTERYRTEIRVFPTPEHPGNSDLYDAAEQAIVDWKVLGPTSLAKIRSGKPPRKYVVQTLLYGLGCQLAGLPVRRVVICALPRTEATLDSLYVWDHPVWSEEDAALLSEVLRVNQIRKQIADEVLAGRISIDEVPITPDDSECFFCLSGDTEVVTRQGVKPIRALAGSTPELLVPRVGPKGGLASLGNFQAAPVRSFGRQRLWEVVLESRGGTKTVHATAEHRWILASGKGWELKPPAAYERITSTLQPGDRLRPLRARTPVGASIMPPAVAQGFTYGDGTVGQGRRPATLAIYDNGKDDALLPFFPMAEPIDYNGVRLIYGLPRFWKELPPLSESRSFLLSWLAGYFAADGTVGAEGRCVLSSADEQSIRFARDVAAVCGIGYSPLRPQLRSGFGRPPTVLWTLSLRRRDLPDWFFIIREHALRAADANQSDARGTYWTVKSVTQTDTTEEVYCATVPGAAAFGLSDDLMTGNCAQYRPQSARDGGPGCAGTIGNRDLLTAG